MVGVVVVTHGDLAGELVRVAEMIVGPQERFRAVALKPDQDVEKIRASIGDAIKSAEDGDGVMVLTDMLGGTPCNLALPFHKEGSVEILTGVNLPMLLKAASARMPGGEGPAGVRELGVAVAEAGRKSVHAASEILRKV